MAVATPGAPPIVMTPNYMNLGYTDTLDLPPAKTAKIEDLEEGEGGVPANAAQYVDPTEDQLNNTQTLAPEKVGNIHFFLARFYLVVRNAL